MDIPEEVFEVQLSTSDGHVAVVNFQKGQRALTGLSDLIDAGEPTDLPALRLIVDEGQIGARRLSKLFHARMDPIFVSAGCSMLVRGD